MKKLVASSFALCLLATSCSSMQPKVEDLKGAQTCSVWKEGTLGIRYAVEVDNEEAKQKMTCWIMNMWGCVYNTYTFTAPGSSEIRSSVLGNVGELKGKTMSAHLTGATVDPFTIGEGRADYKIQGPIGGKREQTVEFNDKCTTRQAALGLMALLGK